MPPLDGFPKSLCVSGPAPLLHFNENFRLAGSTESLNDTVSMPALKQPFDGRAGHPAVATVAVGVMAGVGVAVGVCVGVVPAGRPYGWVMKSPTRLFWYGDSMALL